MGENNKNVYKILVHCLVYQGENREIIVYSWTEWKNEKNNPEAQGGIDPVWVMFIYRDEAHGCSPSHT